MKLRILKEVKNSSFLNLKHKKMKLLILVLVMMVTSCATSHSGCGYAKAKKYNDKQARKSARHHGSNQPWW
jgi:hypothetical protein